MFNEDFGFGGDEFLVGDCRADWDLGPDLEVKADEWEEHQAVLREFADEAREAEVEAEHEAEAEREAEVEAEEEAAWMATMKANWGVK